VKRVGRKWEGKRMRKGQMERRGGSKLEKGREGKKKGA